MSFTLLNRTINNWRIMTLLFCYFCFTAELHSYLIKFAWLILLFSCLSLWSCFENISIEALKKIKVTWLKFGHITIHPFIKANDLTLTKTTDSDIYFFPKDNYSDNGGANISCCLQKEKKSSKIERINTLSPWKP